MFGTEILCFAHVEYHPSSVVSVLSDSSETGLRGLEGSQHMSAIAAEAGKNDWRCSNRSCGSGGARKSAETVICWIRTISQYSICRFSFQTEALLSSQPLAVWSRAHSKLAVALNYTQPDGPPLAALNAYAPVMVWRTGSF